MKWPWQEPIEQDCSGFILQFGAWRGGQIQARSVSPARVRARRVRISSNT